MMNESEIADIKKRVLAKYPFFGGVAANADYIADSTIPKTANDGESIYYNPEYLAGLTAGDQVYALAHELCHVAFRHDQRGEGKDIRVWQVAADAVVNQWLKRDGMNIPAGEIDLPEAIDYDAEQFYEILLAEKIEMDLIGGQIGEDQKLGDGRLADSSDQEDDLDEAKEIRWEEWDPEEDEDVEVEVREVARAGNADKRDTRDIKNIGSRIPRINWRMLLRETVNYGVDWSFQRATIEEGIIRPSLEELPMPETEIVIDTSWSVDDDLLRDFLRECKNILKFSKVKAGCFDTRFYGFKEIKTDTDIDEMVFEGGGGTDFNVATEAFSLRVDNRVIFTDGQAPMPDKPLNAIWLVYGDEEINPPGGRVIHIPIQQQKP